MSIPEVSATNNPEYLISASEINAIIDALNSKTPTTNVVNSVNGVSGPLTISAGTNVTVTVNGSTITIASSGSGGSTSAWYTGASVPLVGLGNNGDFYLDTGNGYIYNKVSGAWVAILNVVGATGATGTSGTNGTNGINGSTWYYGIGVPSSGTGNNGDFYINTANGYVYVKISGTWTFQVNLTGPQGTSGGSGSGEPHIGWNYLVYLSTGTYYARNGRTGVLDSSSSDLYTLITYCIAHLDSYGGRIYLDLDGSQTLSQAIVIPSSGSIFSIPQYTITLQGKGRESTVLTMTSGQHGIILNGSVNNSYLRDFSIAGGGTGNAIKTMVAGILDTDVMFGKWENININYQGSDWAVKLDNVFLASMENIFVFAYGTAKGCMAIYQENGSVNYGNSYFNHVYLQLQSTTVFDPSTGVGSGLLLQADHGSWGISTFDGIQILDGNYSSVDQCAICLFGNIVGNTFNISTCEGWQWLIYANGSVESCKFHFNYASCFAQTMFRFSSGAQGNYITAELINTDNTTTVMDDLNLTVELPNVYENIMFTGASQPTLGTTNVAIMRGWTGSRNPLIQRRFDANDKACLERGSSGVVGVLKIWDAIKNAWAYYYSNNGVLTYSASEPA